MGVAGGERRRCWGVAMPAAPCTPPPWRGGASVPAVEGPTSVLSPATPVPLPVRVGGGGRSSSGKAARPPAF